VPTYLVERYWPGVTTARILETLKGGCRVLEQMDLEGTCIRDIICVFIPREEVVFSLYEGPSLDAIRAFNERAAIPTSRIVEAIAVTGHVADRPMHGTQSERESSWPGQ
jgi:hypothetical protein